MSAYLPFDEPVVDWSLAASWLAALVFSVAFHGLMNWMPELSPLQHGGVDEWRVAGSVQFVEYKPVAEKAEPVNKLPPKPESVKPKSEPKPQPQPTPLVVDKQPKPASEPQTVAEVLPEPAVEPITESSSQGAEEVEPDSNVAELENAEAGPSMAERLLAVGSVTKPAGVPLVAYRSRIIELINAKKSYPRVARRRGIEGAVEVSFTVTVDGRVTDLVCEGSRDVFEQSACETITAAMPFPSPQDGALQLSFVMDYVLE